jgi:hypothetical protein
MIHFYTYYNPFKLSLCYYRDDGKFGSTCTSLKDLHNLRRFDFFLGTINWADFIKTRPVLTYFTAPDDYTPAQLLADYPELFI